MTVTQTLLQNYKAFEQNLKREITRIREFKQRTALLLVEVNRKERSGKKYDHEFGNKADVEKIYQYLSEFLRGRDSIYLVDEDRLAAILPNTDEAGGEAAAQRFKKFLSKSITERLDLPYPISVGVLSLDEHYSGDYSEIVDALERDLLRDREFEEITYDLDKEGPERDEKTKHVVLLGCKSKELATVASILSFQEGYAIHVSYKLQDALEALSGQRKGVFLLGPDISPASKLEICKKIRSNRELYDKFVIWLQTHSESDTQDLKPTKWADEILPEDIGIDQIVRSVKAGFRFVDLTEQSFKIPKLFGILDFIGSASHKLNQPLQIIIGKIEILLLDMEDGTNSAELREIRKQALRASDINHKIGRLTKHNIS